MKNAQDDDRISWEEFVALLRARLRNNIPKGELTEDGLNERAEYWATQIRNEIDVTSRIAVSSYLATVCQNLGNEDQGSADEDDERDDCL